MDDKKNFEYKEDYYYLKLGYYKGTKFLKVEAINESKTKVIELTCSGIELFLPPPPTPDCVVLNYDKHKDLIEKLKKLGVVDYNPTMPMCGQFSMNNLYDYDPKGVKKFIDDFKEFLTEVKPKNRKNADKGDR